MLERFRKAKAKEIARLRHAAEKGAMPAPYEAARPSFSSSLTTGAMPGPLALIAEYKRASPSRGIIRRDLAVEDVASQYARAGANAMSILTEEEWFRGDFAFLELAAKALAAGGNMPLLRKDFIFDPLQVRQTAASPASALLLIVRLTPDARELRELRELAESFGIECVVEIFDAADLRLARDSGARIIQVNARDLQTLAVDRESCLDIRKRYGRENGEIWIAASGMETSWHLREAADAGFQAALVGTSLMTAGSPYAAVRRLLEMPQKTGGADAD